MKNLNEDFCIFRGTFNVVVINRRNKANDLKMANFGNLVDLNRSLVDKVKGIHESLPTA